MECGNSVAELGGLVVGTMLVSELDPPNAEWDLALDQLVRYLHRHAVPAERVRLLTITQGGTPSTRQRAGLKVAFDGKHPKVGVISGALDSPLKRGMATAIQWINPQVALFGPEQAREALAYLNLEHATDLVLKQLLELEKQMRPLRVMRTVAEQLAAAPGASSQTPAADGGSEQRDR